MIILWKLLCLYVSDEQLHAVLLRLETAELTFKQVTQQWTEVYDLLSVTTSMTH